MEGRSGELPVWEMAARSTDELKRAAEAIAAELGDIDAAKIEAVAVGSVTGGGSLPDVELPSWGVRVGHAEKSAAELERALRADDPPVIARIEDDRLLLDLRTVGPDQKDLLVSALRTALN
jgi:L-seryl-tRNA(Ser) seleniumtransferase